MLIHALLRHLLILALRVRALIFLVPLLLLFLLVVGVIDPNDVDELVLLLRFRRHQLIRGLLHDLLLKLDLPYFEVILSEQNQLRVNTNLVRFCSWSGATGFSRTEFSAATA